VHPTSTTSKQNSHTCCERAGSSQFVDAHAEGAPNGRCAPTIHHLHTKLTYMCERRMSSQFVDAHAEGALNGRCAPTIHHLHTKLTYMCERRMSSHLCVLARPWGRSGGAVRPPSTTVTPNSQTCCERAGSSHVVYAHVEGGAQGALCTRHPPPPTQTRRHVVKEQDHLTLCTRMPRGRCAPTFHPLQNKLADMF
jgi:hypothetical protein